MLGETFECLTQTFKGFLLTFEVSSAAPQACGHMPMHAHMIPRRPAWGLCKPHIDRSAPALLLQTPKASAICEVTAREREGGLMQARLGASSAHGVSDGAGRGRSHRGPPRPPRSPSSNGRMLDPHRRHGQVGNCRQSERDRSRRRTRLSIFATERLREHICVALGPGICIDERHLTLAQ